jgi:hypothetical protein
MEGPPAAGTEVLLEIDRDIFTRQMIGKCAFSQVRFWRGGWCWMGCLHPAEIDVEVFQSQSKLIAVEPFWASSKLAALKTLDDQAETLDLSLCCRKLRVIIGHLRGQLAHQSMQGIDVER